MARQADGTYVVSTYREIVALLHDPRVSSDLPQPPPQPARGRTRTRTPGCRATFISLDPPEHDRLRRLAMRHFGPPHTPGRIDGMRPELAEIVTGLIDDIAGKHQDRRRRRLRLPASRSR